MERGRHHGLAFEVEGRVQACWDARLSPELTKQPCKEGLGGVIHGLYPCAAVHMYGCGQLGSSGVGGQPHHQHVSGELFRACG